MEFTKVPQSTKLHYDGLKTFGDKDNNRTIPDDVTLPPMTKLLLEHQRSKLQPNKDTSQPLDIGLLMKGFKNDNNAQQAPCQVAILE